MEVNDLTENVEASEKLEKAQVDYARAVQDLQAAQNGLSQAISSGDSVAAKGFHRKRLMLEKRIVEDEIGLEACRAGVRHAELKKILEVKQTADKVLEAIPEPSTEPIVDQEIANVRITAPLCSTCYRKMSLNNEMPYVSGRTANWLWSCKGTPQDPHPISMARQDRLLLYPWRKAITPETFKAAMSGKPHVESAPTPLTLSEQQIELAQRMAPNCPDCNAKMTLSRKEPLNIHPSSAIYQYTCHGSKTTRLHAPASFNYEVPLLKHVSTGVTTSTEGLAIPRTG